MFKHIVSKTEVPSVTLVRKLKLYGLQFYNNIVYVYNMSKPCDYAYVFVKDVEFPVPDDSSILNQSLPTFFKNFSSISRLIESTNTVLDEMLSIDKDQEVLPETIGDPSPHVSTRKNQKARAQR